MRACLAVRRPSVSEMHYNLACVPCYQRLHSLPRVPDQLGNLSRDAAVREKYSTSAWISFRIPRCITGRRTQAVQAVSHGEVASTAEAAARNAKERLLGVVKGTHRGAKASYDERAAIEEAQVELEALGGATLEAGLDALDGLWKLRYTSAPDVVGILQAPTALPLPLLQVGDIFQRFVCRGSLEEGRVLNIVRWSVAGVLEEAEGATLTVAATFRVRSPRSIALQFEEAALGDVRISAGAEALLAPALLPRGAASLQLLQALRSLDLRLPLRTPSSRPTPTAAVPRDRGARYQLTFLDATMLVGRALTPPGSFVFERALEDLA